MFSSQNALFESISIQKINLDAFALQHLQPILQKVLQIQMQLTMVFLMLLKMLMALLKNVTILLETILLAITM
jgi:hypothetical protein